MMKKTKKKIIIIVGIIIALALFVIIRINNHIITQREAEREVEIAMELEATIRETYWRVNSAFGMTVYRAFEYRPLTELNRNRFGINTWSYLHLKRYELETGMVLSYELVADYFSEEFEPDGSLRLYNNGYHPEIQAFVEWVWEVPIDQRLREMDEFHLAGIVYILFNYRKANEEFPDIRTVDMSPKMLDALVRAYADPDYELDLTSLLEAGY